MAGTAQWVAESVPEILQISGLTLQTFLVFCATFFLACVIFKRSQNLPPYPAGRVPVLGHLLALGRAPLRKLTAWRRQYGDVFTVRMGMEDVVVLNGYTAVKDALVDRSELFASRLPVYLLDAMSGFGKDDYVSPEVASPEVASPEVASPEVVPQEARDTIADEVNKLREMLQEMPRIIPVSAAGPATGWTRWYDRDNPSASGDWETLSTLRRENPGKICAAPSGIQARVKGTNRPASLNGDRFFQFNPQQGIVCRNADQCHGRCHDYEVRFWCP
uniref:WxxW domain-containing protein n=1 Tax=Branchiostoma floridae TaxID=7739 RepID=C3ZFT2_BRAFL|eukprot:XP_002592559.1 hypothetical protein BRAFLDRAFT_68881 [Branchiostoma floridae]